MWLWWMAYWIIAGVVAVGFKIVLDRAVSRSVKIPTGISLSRPLLEVLVGVLWPAWLVVALAVYVMAAFDRGR